MSKLNLPLPYNIVKEEDLYYTFTTESGIKYTAYFISISQYGDNLEDTYMFNFDHEETETKHLHDSRIKATIIHIIERFFETNINSMIYICDSLDGKELVRKKLFDKWYNEYIRENESPILKEDLYAEGDYYNLCASLFILSINPKLKYIIDDFKKLQDLFVP